MKRISFFLYAVIVVLGFSLANLLFSFLTKPKKITPPSFSPVISTAEVPLEEKIEEKKIIEEKELTKEAPSFTLSGILYSDIEKWALINNRILKEGDIIEEAKVTGIYENEVELSLEGEKIILKLK